MMLFSVCDSDADDHLHLCLFSLLQLSAQLRHHGCQLLLKLHLQKHIAIFLQFEMKLKLIEN